MMVLDSSAIVAILLYEKEAPEFSELIRDNPPVFVSAASIVETSIVIENRKGDQGGRELDLLIYRGSIEIVPVDTAQAEIAREAWRKYGKGRHAAGLNFGDCFSYALAKSMMAPLLFKGGDFSATDVFVQSRTI